MDCVARWVKLMAQDRTLSDRKYYLANREAVSARNRAWQKANLKKYKAAKAQSSRKYYLANRETLLARSWAWQHANIERHRIHQLRSQKKCAGAVRANAARYRAAKAQRVPAWADLNAITQFYKDCPQGMTVDHIVPLQGFDWIEGKRVETVRGLHVPWNLVYLPATENLSKNGRFIPDEYDAMAAYLAFKATEEGARDSL